MYRLLVLLFSSSVYAQIQLDGSCNFTNIDHLTSINVTEFAGKWYLIERVPYITADGDCATTTLKTVTDNNGTVTELEVTNTQVYNNKLLQKNGTITWSNASFPGELKVTYSDGSSRDYVLVDTDYNDYALMYSCQNNGTNRVVWGWKLGRNLTYSDRAKNTTDYLVKANVDLANVTTWKVVQHTENHCKIHNSAISERMSPIFVLLVGLTLVKQLF